MAHYVAVFFVEILSQKDVSPFQKILSKFLTTNTLQTVCPWLEDIVAQEITSACDEQCPSDHQSSFVYRPPLYTVNTRPLSTFVQPNPDARAVDRVFGVPVGFFWETLETGDECFPDLVLGGDGGDVEGGLQTTMMLISSGLFCNGKVMFCDGKVMMAILSCALQAGLSVTGVRLLYPTVEQIGTFPLKFSPHRLGPALKAKSAADTVPVVEPVLALALRGAGARAVWLDVVGPSDPMLARRIDPNSLCALFGGDSRDSCLLYCPRNLYQTNAEVVRWFGGRVPESRVITVGQSLSRPRESGKSRKSQPAAGENHAAVMPNSTQAAMLCAMTHSDVFLAVSPLVPSHGLALVLCICQRRGYKVCGVKRMHLSSKRASQLGE